MKIYIPFTKSIVPFIIMLFAMIHFTTLGQSGSFGNTFIFRDTETGIISVQQNFLLGGNGVLCLVL